MNTTTRHGNGYLTHEILEVWAVTRQAPLWIAVAMYALANADETGRVHLKRGQLKDEVDPFSSAGAIWSAVQRAIEAGWLMPGSTTMELRVK